MPTFLDEIKNECKDLRRSVGLDIRVGAGSGPMVSQLYHVTWEDGREIRSAIVRGRTVFTLPGFRHVNGTKKQMAESNKDFHPELHQAIKACGELIGSMSNACWDLDDNPPKFSVYDDLRCEKTDKPKAKKRNKKR